MVMVCKGGSGWNPLAASISSYGQDLCGSARLPVRRERAACGRSAGRLLSGVRGLGILIAPNARGHLVLQVEFSFLETLLFELVLDGDVLLLGQFREARFAGMVLFEPMSEFLVLFTENPLNVIGLIGHP
jgi:hypothetical protein